MDKEAVPQLWCALVTAPSLTLSSTVKATALPPPLLVAAAILGLVAVFGAIFSLLLRKRSRSGVCR
ncbi:MAG: hypothetical protein M1167_02795 [Chloroflexi bacterium]|nr:hypothetical protein [Chloroflexota bacterium]